MRNKREIEQKAERIEKMCVLFRDHYIERVNPDYKLSEFQLINRQKLESELGIKVPGDLVKLAEEHFKLSEQMAVLRWVIDSEWEWDESGIRDT
jgi:diaminopimelate decarboxylase